MPRIIKLLLFLLLGNYTSYAQKTISLFYEKGYVHTDRDVYTQGDDIWFKAYLVNAQNNQPLDYSKNLYVELINPGSVIISRRVIRLENGLGNGDFKISDTVATGKYHIRAYTNWMRNFDDKFVFEKNISIVNTVLKPKTPAVIKSHHPTQTPITKPIVALLPTVMFFPEGGTMINDVRSLIAVKAEDAFGKGIAISGNIIATSGRIVAKFTSDTLGMASFNLIPDETQDYHAEAIINNQLQSFNLPKALHKGFALSINTIPGFIVTSINCNGFALSDNVGNDFSIEVKHGKTICYKQMVHISSSLLLLQIPDANMPEGIACVTLYDDHAKPLSERLVYVHHANNTNLTLTTDKTSYQPKEMVTVNIKLTDTTKTNLSMAVIDAGLIPVKPESILTYLQLTSEIKGTIAHPEIYFDTANLNRFNQLDLLLLTQGWRDFVWKQIDDYKFKMQYEVEPALVITGKVRNTWIKRTVPNINITMFAPKATGAKLFTTVTDSTGRFRIDGAVLYGYQYVNFTSRTSHGIKDDGTSRGKSGGWIQVDSLFQDRMPVAKYNLLDTLTYKPDLLAEREKEKQKFTFTGNNLLKPVLIKTKTTTFLPEIHPITLAEHKMYDCVGQYLINMIPGAYWVMPGGVYNIKTHMIEPYEPPYIKAQMGSINVYGIYADNSPIIKANQPPPIQDDYLAQPMDRVLNVVIYKHQSPYGMSYGVKLTLRPGSLEVKDIFDNTMADMVGYNRAKVFFAPKYPVMDTKPDLRTTIHWEPNITTNQNGEATVSFYNADPKSKICIIVQGITEKGVPLSATSTYSVN